MSLKFMLESLDGVDAAIAGLYVPEGTKFRLDVEGAVDRAKLDEFRNNNIELKKQLENFKDIDPAKYKELQQLQSKVDQKQLVDAGNIDAAVTARVQQMNTEHKTALDGLTSQNETLSRQLESLLVDSAVRVKAIELGALPTAVEDIMLRAKTAFKIVDGVATPHADGKVVYGKDGVNPMPVDEWIVNLSKGAPHLFGKSQGGGAGGSGGPLSLIHI